MEGLDHGVGGLNGFGISKPPIEKKMNQFFTRKKMTQATERQQLVLQAAGQQFSQKLATGQALFACFLCQLHVVLLLYFKTCVSAWIFM